MRVRFLCRGGIMAAGGGAVATAVVILLASPAFAHDAGASVTQTCVNGTSHSTVHFTNNYPLSATLTYAGPAAGTVGLPAAVGATLGTNSVTLAVPAPATLTYTVRWTDGHTQGVQSVALLPITNCLPETVATTVPVIDTSIVASTVPPVDTSAVAASAPDSVVIVPIPPAASVLANSIVAEVPVAAAPTATLPSTGSDPIAPLAIAAGLILVGALLAATRSRVADRP